MTDTRKWLSQLLQLDSPSLAGFLLAGLQNIHDNDRDKIQEHIDKIIEVHKQSLS